MMVQIGNVLFHYRNFIFPLALLLVLLPGPRILDNTLTAALLGLAIALVGQTIRVVTIGLVYIIRGGRNRQVYAENLITDGIYAHCRNPMYVGNLLIVSAVALTSNSWGCVAVAVPLFTFFYLAIVNAEEAYLRGLFGEAYRRYETAVPRFIPRITGLVETFQHSEFHWRRVLSKEYGTLAGWPLRWMLVLVYALWRDGELHRYPNLFSSLGTALIALGLAYAAVRILKKRRRLQSD